MNLGSLEEKRMKWTDNFIGAVVINKLIFNPENNFSESDVPMMKC